MRLATPIKLGVPALVILALAAVMAFMAWGNGGAAGGLGETALLSSNVEWTVYGSDGILKNSGEGHNAASTTLLQSMRNRAFALASVLAADVYDDVALCDENPNNGAAEGFTPLACDNSGTGLYSGGIIDNPATDVGPVNTVNGTQPTSVITASFEANGDATIREFQLIKAGSSTIAGASDIAAVRDVFINLILGDTLEIVWTVNFAGTPP